MKHGAHRIVLLATIAAATTVLVTALTDRATRRRMGDIEEKIENVGQLAGLGAQDGYITGYLDGLEGRPPDYPAGRS